MLSVHASPQVWRRAKSTKLYSSSESGGLLKGRDDARCDVLILSSRGRRRRGGRVAPSPTPEKTGTPRRPTKKNIRRFTQGFRLIYMTRDNLQRPRTSKGLIRGSNPRPVTDEKMRKHEIPESPKATIIPLDQSAELYRRYPPKAGKARF